MSNPAESPIPSHVTLGEVRLLESSETFDLDVKINEGYQAFSGELLQLSVLALGGVYAAWKSEKGLQNSNFILGAVICLVLSAGAALAHRYASTDGLAWQLEGLRRKQRNDQRQKDLERARHAFSLRRRHFRACKLFLFLSPLLMFVALVSFALAIYYVAPEEQLNVGIQR